MPLWRMVWMAVNLIGFRLGGAAIGLATQILLARLLPQDSVGVVLMAMSAAAIISLVMTAGYPSLSMTCLARQYALGRKSLSHAFHVAAWRDTLAVSVAVAVLIAALQVFRPLNDSLTTALVFGGLTAPFSSLIRMTSSTANSQRRFNLASIPDFLFRPGLLLAYLLAVFVFGWSRDLLHVLWVIVGAAAAVGLAQAVILGREAMPVLVRTSRHDMAPALRSRAVSLVIVAAATIAFADVVTLLGGLYLPPKDVAAFGIAIRIAALAGFVTQVTQQMVLPDLTAAIVKGNATAVRTLLKRVNLMAVSVLSLGVVICILFGPLILHIFGESYRSAHWPLVLFMTSQLIRAAGGMNQHLLSIEGFQARTATSCIFAISMLAAAVTLLVPGFGVLGIAMAVIISDLVWSGLLAWQTHRYARFRGDLLAVLTTRA